MCIHVLKQISAVDLKFAFIWTNSAAAVRFGPVPTLFWGTGTRTCGPVPHFLEPEPEPRGSGSWRFGPGSWRFEPEPYIIYYIFLINIFSCHLAGKYCICIHKLLFPHHTYSSLVSPNAPQMPASYFLFTTLLLGVLLACMYKVLS